MSESFRRDVAASQPDSLDQQESARATFEAQPEEHIEMLRVFVRQSMEEAGHNTESMAAAMGYRDASYPGKVLKGEKPLSLVFLVTLPRDVRTLFVDKWAEHHELICVQPLTGKAAREALVAGFFGVTAPQLPVRADRMATATMPGKARKQA